MNSSGHLLLVGSAGWATRLVSVLFESRFLVTLTQDLSSELDHDLALVELCSVHDLAKITSAGHAQRPWIGVGSDRDGPLVTAAYAAGALAIISSSLPMEQLLQTIRRALDLRQRKTVAHRQTRLGAGTVVTLGEEDLLTVTRGVIAQVALHEDGAEVLLGLWGEGAVVPGHPQDACCLELRAHTSVDVKIESWDRVRSVPRVLDALRRRGRRLEAWSSMQARPHMEQRLAGILSLLADQFGIPADGGKRIELRVTHAQLASAIGANRVTVTRILGRLRRRGDLESVATRDGERWVFHGPDACHHGSFSSAS